MLRQIHSAFRVLALQVTISVRNEYPRDDPADGRKSRTNEEHRLRALLRVTEGATDTSEPVSVYPENIECKETKNEISALF